ncbi:uncharacterized protein EV420DRAFT_1485121 [Desarmillaria tabescens]|uniref:Uncharacterized protein n=1 Tax=Armillaria tabescens TaxID=1929756 RepID=A0AA39MQ73_ARMTA|nr:uncharacterized protein EV420DRAFT_1485121 [Desarmillaria tabescens]KAK0443011.1 hypothetical protein EV420DRAFT_1485121 [Desarmillaria tabescens]
MPWCYPDTCLAICAGRNDHCQILLTEAALRSLRFPALLSVLKIRESEESIESLKVVLVVQGVTEKFLSSPAPPQSPGLSESVKKNVLEVQVSIRTDWRRHVKVFLKAVVRHPGSGSAEVIVGKGNYIPAALITHTATPITTDPEPSSSTLPAPATQVVASLPSLIPSSTSINTVTASPYPAAELSSVQSSMQPLTTIEIDTALPPYSSIPMQLSTSNESDTAPPPYSATQNVASQLLILNPAPVFTATNSVPSTHPAAQGITAQSFIPTNVPINIRRRGTYFPPGSVPQF